MGSEVKECSWQNDQQVMRAIKLLPDMLGLLKSGHSSEMSITVVDDAFVVNLVSHQTCDEHGCNDEDCRLIVHDKSIAINMGKLDEILSGMFMSALTTPEKLYMAPASS